jgi:hydrogenase maturation protease
MIRPHVFRMKPVDARVIGIGNAWRRDDAAGLLVARALAGTLPGVAVLEREGEPAGLIDSWDGAAALWLVDAVSSGAPPGTVRRIDVADEELPPELFRASTHHLGLAEAVELARALDRLPARVVFYGIEGASFDAGEGLTAEVERAVAQVAKAVREEVEQCTSAS